LRTTIYLVHASITKLRKQHLITDKQDDAALGLFASGLKSTTDFIPPWVKVAVAVALGCGTMIGWKRIVVTVGEKIGKSHLTYAQGASAELVAMATIQVADIYGLPVSTTHVLSSGIAGTMAANRSGLQMAHSEIYFWRGFSRSRFVSFSVLQLSRPDFSLCSMYFIGSE